MIDYTRIKNARKMKKLTCQELADKVGVTKQAISDFERGKKKPSDRTFQNIINALEVKVDFFADKRPFVGELKIIHISYNNKSF